MKRVKSQKRIFHRTKLRIVNYSRILGMCVHFFAGTVSQFNFMQMEPILAYRLTEKNLNTMKIGLSFTIYPYFYLISSVSSSKFYSKKIEKRVIMILSLIFYSIALTLAGPSELLNYPDSIVLMCAGLGLGVRQGGERTAACAAAGSSARGGRPG